MILKFHLSLKVMYMLLAVFSRTILLLAVSSRSIHLLAVFSRSIHLPLHHLIYGVFLWFCIRYLLNCTDILFHTTMIHLFLAFFSFIIYHCPCIFLHILVSTIISTIFQLPSISLDTSHFLLLSFQFKRFLSFLSLSFLLYLGVQHLFHLHCFLTFTH